MPEPNPAPTESPDDWTRPLVERRLQVLGELAEIGLEVARAVERQARAAGPDVDLKRLSMAYARAARAVRMTVALQSRLSEALKAREAAAAEQRAEAEAEADDALAARLETQKVRVAGIVERVLEAEHEDYDEVSRLVLKAERLLDDESLYDDILSRPIGELVACICRDLGLSPDWPRLAEEAWAKKEIESGVEGSPFAASPIAGAMAGGDGPCAGQRFGRHANARSALRAGAADPGEKLGEERVVEGASRMRHAPTSPVRDSS